jgi:hypothetical protein
MGENTREHDESKIVVEYATDIGKAAWKMQLAVHEGEGCQTLILWSWGHYSYTLVDIPSDFDLPDFEGLPYGEVAALLGGPDGYGGDAKAIAEHIGAKVLREEDGEMVY